MREHKVLDEFIKSVPMEKAEKHNRATLRGRALSKDEKRLHFAIDTGVVAIPLESIEQVTTLNSSGEYAEILVSNANAIEYIRKVQPIIRQHDRGAQAPAPQDKGQARKDTNSLTWNCDDTATVTGGDYDMTDDGICTGSEDDILV